MGFYRPITLAFIFAVSLILPLPGQIISSWQMHLRHHLSQGQVDYVLDQLSESDNYLNIKPLLRDISIQILKMGLESDKPEVQIQALYAASQTKDPEFIEPIRKRLLSYHPLNQLAALRSLSFYSDSETLQLIQTALSSPYLPIRIEAVYMLANLQKSNAHNQIKALSQHMPDQARSILPSLYALDQSPSSIKELKQLLIDSNKEVSIAAIHAARHFKIYDLKDVITHLTTSSHPAIAEAAIYASGIFDTKISKHNIRSKADEVQLAFIRSEFEQNRLSYQDLIDQTKFYKTSFTQSDPFYLSPENLDRHEFSFYYTGLMNNMPNILEPLGELLSRYTVDWGFYPVFSLGQSLIYPKLIPSYRLESTKNPSILPFTSQIRKIIIQQAFTYPENEVISFYNRVVELPDWTPLIMEQINSNMSPRLITQLKLWANTPGNPYIRAWANLLLFKHHIKPSAQARLLEWLKRLDFNICFSYEIPTSRTQPHFPIATRIQPQHYCLLIYKICNKLLQTNPKELIALLIEKLIESDQTSRYSLAGILYKASEG